MLAKSIFHGRLTKDIELKQTKSGIAYCRFQIAFDRYVGGEKKTVTEYPTFVAWRSTAERLAKYTQKGSELVIDSEYTSYKKEVAGEKYPVTIVEFEVQAFDFCGNKNDGHAVPKTAPAAAPASASYASSIPSYDDFEELEGGEDDLPF